MSTPLNVIDANTADTQTQSLQRAGKQTVEQYNPLAANTAAPKSNLEHQRELLRQKLAAGEGHTTASPTDSLMSPCTAKLQANKKVHYKKAKPLSLQSRFSMAANPAASNKENN